VEVKDADSLNFGTKKLESVFHASAIFTPVKTLVGVRATRTLQSFGALLASQPYKVAHVEVRPACVCQILPFVLYVTKFTSNSHFSLQIKSSVVHGCRCSYLDILRNPFRKLK
jgi:hypothetical protein